MDEGDQGSQGEGGFHEVIAGQRYIQDQLASVIQEQRAVTSALAELRQSMGEHRQGEAVAGSALDRPSSEIDAAPPACKVAATTDAIQAHAPADDASQSREVNFQPPAPALAHPWWASACVRPELAAPHDERVAQEVSEETFRPHEEVEVSRALSDVVRGTRRPRCMVDPTSRVRTCFDLLSVVALTYDLSVTPCVMAWDLPFDGFVRYITYITTCFWSLDILLHFRTGYFRGAHLEMRQGRVARRYLRTTFSLDLALVSLDVLTLVIHDTNLGVTPSGVKLVRIMKVSRLFRIFAGIRMVHLADIMDRNKYILQCTSIALEVGQILLAILYINHVAGCAWWWLGCHASSDTAYHWVDQPVSWAADAATIEDSTFYYQYLTSLHWILCQMTPGSMQVTPVNSVERAFNVVCLLLGLVAFGSLISMLSSKMTSVRMLQQGQAKMLKELDRFLRQSNFTSQLVMKINRQVKQRLAEQKLLTLKGVEALKYVPASTFAEIRFEYCQSRLVSHPLFRVFAAISEGLVRKICRHCVEMSFLHPGDTLFEAGDEEGHTYIVNHGSLEYIQDPLTSCVKERTSERVDDGQWISEGALWCPWTMVGSIDASSPCELVAIEAAKCAGILAGHPLSHEIAQEYAILFCARLNACACPSDLRVPDAEFEELVLAAPWHVQVFLGLVSVQILRGQRWVGAWAWTWHMERLEQEVRQGESNLVVSRMGEVCRLTAVVVISISDREGRVFAQLGERNEDSRGSRPACRLPGTKVRGGEAESDAVRRKLDGWLRPFAGTLVSKCVDRVVEERRSDTYGIKTKYIRHVHHMALGADCDPCLVVNGRPAKGALATEEGRGLLVRGCCTARPPRHAALLMLPDEVSIFTDGTSVFFGAWLRGEQLRCLSDPASQHRLQHFLDGLELTAAMLEECRERQDAAAANYAALRCSL